jgi:hypothetical protein
VAAQLNLKARAGAPTSTPGTLAQRAVGTGPERVIWAWTESATELMICFVNSMQSSAQAGVEILTPTPVVVVGVNLPARCRLGSFRSA